jgi:hypothetical protein
MIARPNVGASSVTNVLILPAYVELRVELTRALAPFPEARQAVAAALHRPEANSAAAVKAESREFAHP